MKRIDKIVAEVKLIDELVAGVNPRAKMPPHFALWDAKLQIMWLKQHQRKK